MTDNPSKVSSAHHDDHHHGLAHISPWKLLVGVWFWLMVFTVITVAASKLEANKYIDLGNLSIWVALVIATIKGTLVIMYFMHLKYDKPFNSFIFLSTLLFVGIFLGFAMTDSGQYQDSVRARQDSLKSEKPSGSSYTQMMYGNQTSFSTRPVVGDYVSSLELDANSNNGYKVWKQVCSGCHKIGSEGTEIGPDLTRLTNSAPGAILTNVLDPNFAVLPNYIQHVLMDDRGRVFTGIIAQDAKEFIVLRRDNAADVKLERSKIEEIKSTGKSLMPEGLENQIDRQQMADLIAFLRSKQITGQVSPATTSEAKPH